MVKAEMFPVETIKIPVLNFYKNPIFSFSWTNAALEKLPKIFTNLFRIQFSRVRLTKITIFCGLLVFIYLGLNPGSVT